MNRPLSGPFVLALATACVAGAVPSALRAGSQSPSAPIGAGPTALSALQTRIDRLDALTERVEALSAIKRLQHAYGHYSELGLWHDFADLFADTGIGYYTQGALDREGIRSLFLKEVGQGRLGLADGRIYPHVSMQPVVTLASDGQSGRGRWHIMAMLGGYGTSASWAGGVYENQYVRENGVWKFKEVRYLPQYGGRYENPGWTATNQPAPPHYDASLVGRPVLDVAARPGAAPPTPPTLAAMSERMADVAARAQRLGDEIEVTNLQHAYGYYADRKMWDDAADLFAANATMEIGLGGVYAGRTSIRRALNAAPAGTPQRRSPAGVTDGDVNDHIHLQTIVTVAPDGRTARARGTDLGMTTGPTVPGGPSQAGTAGVRALWSQSIYENEFVKQDGVWKFQAMRIYPRFIVDAELGWAKDAQPAPGPSRDFPPDRPPTEAYGVFPRFHIAPLHFDHPVTGRSPQYPASAEATAGKPAPSIAPSSVGSAFRRTAPVPATTTAALASLVAATEHSVERSKAYHASENLAAAHGYSSDESGPPGVLALHQVVQPVIHVAADARSAKIRARLFQLGGPAGGAGSWTSGIYQGTSVDEGGTWKLSRMNLAPIWTAPSRGGWARVKTAPALPFHYRNPVSGRMPPVLLP